MLGVSGPVPGKGLMVAVPESKEEARKGKKKSLEKGMLGGSTNRKGKEVRPSWIMTTSVKRSGPGVDGRKSAKYVKKGCGGQREGEGRE